MSSRPFRLNWRVAPRWGAAVFAAAAITFACTAAAKAEPSPAGRAIVPSVRTDGPGTRTDIVHFSTPGQMPVRVVRGPSTGPLATGPSAEAPQRPPGVEVVGFGEGRSRTVTVVRGTASLAAFAALPPTLRARGERTETVTFADPRHSAVTIVRGAMSLAREVGLFDPATGGELDRFAFAVDGVESGHGRNPRMWRPELDGPQGPMQVSAAAALDVGGGNRFDMRENRLLGRAYLARMYQRYGNWPDALAAYNWGPGNLDAWIAAGRLAERLPLETSRYITLVLRNALIAAPRL